MYNNDSMVTPPKYRIGTENTPTPVLLLVLRLLAALL